VEKDCSNKMEEYAIRKSRFFNEALYQETMLLIEKYYKIEDTLKLLQSKL
jgi:hypothetical protein